MQLSTGRFSATDNGQAILMLLPDFLELFGLYTARKLFTGYQTGEVFTELAATRLKDHRLGRCLAGAGFPDVANHQGIFYFTMDCRTQGGFASIISLEDTDVYAIVFGLLIVVIGYVMYEAARICEENKGFV